MSERQKKNLQFSKENALRKGRSGAYSQGDTCLKFSQAEGNVEAALVHPTWNIDTDLFANAREKPRRTGIPRHLLSFLIQLKYFP